MAKTMSEELAALCVELEHWRRYGGGGRGKRIPATLWERAAAVAGVDGVIQTARATRLSQSRLELCLAEAARAAARPVGSRKAGSNRPRTAQRREALACNDSAQFVTVEMTPVERPRSMTIELISRSGERMRIESTDALDLTGVVQSFWSSRS